MGVPVEIVVDGMILRAVVFAAKAHVQAGNSGEILEGSVIGTVSQRADGEVALLATGAALLCVFGSGNAGEMRPLKYGGVSFRVVDVARYAADETLQILSAT